MEALVIVRPRTWELKTRSLEIERLPIIMGILNTTPDSFSDGGRYRSDNADQFEIDIEKVVATARAMLRDGAGILDVGGESTRPGSEPISEAEELRRVIPVIRALHEAFDAPISVDTYRPEVANAALESGAEIINDISAGRYIGTEQRLAGETETGFPEEMAEVALCHGAGVVLMHMRPFDEPEKYPNGVMEEVFAFLKRRRNRFIELGVSLDKLAFDPGLGFGKTFDQNWELLRRVEMLSALGGVTLVGDSRKRFLVETAWRFNASRGVDSDEFVDPTSLSTRDAVTASTTVSLARRGVEIIRVHNVAISAFALETANRAGDLDVLGST